MILTITLFIVTYAVIIMRSSVHVSCNKGVACITKMMIIDYIVLRSSEKMSLVKAQPEARMLKFVLPPDVKFGYHK